MGACYSAALTLFFKDDDAEREATKTLKEFVLSERANFSLEKYDKSTLDNVDGLIRICLAGRGNAYCFEDSDEKREYSNDFDASYGWEGVLIDMFELLTPYLKDGAELDIDIDNDYDTLRVLNGKCVQIH